jgi:hypothetical protein
MQTCDNSMPLAFSHGSKDAGATRIEAHYHKEAHTPACGLVRPILTWVWFVCEAVRAGAGLPGGDSAQALSIVPKPIDMFDDSVVEDAGVTPSG